MSIRSGLVLGLCALALASAGVGCGDDTDGGPSDGGNVAPDAMSIPCQSDGECDDDLFCNGVEQCLEDVCVPGEPVVCDDDVACTQDRCSERLRACEFLPPDEDGDGHGSAACKDADGNSLGDDCDDGDPLRFPGNIEYCDADHHDEDCDPTTYGIKDSDDDGFHDMKCCNRASDAPDAELLCGNDCDDLKPSVHPGATEVCDQYDNDCDGETDETVSVDMYPDKDFDGHGAKSAKAEKQCPGTVGYSLLSDDCKDDDPEVFEGQFEICDGKDNDCDGKIDEVREDAPWFLDADGDGFGDATSTPIYSCERIPGRVLSSSDCNDGNAAVHPAAAELCDAIDNNCDGKKNFRIGTNDFEDDDDDGIADAKCTPAGTDCADDDPTTGAGLDEICDKRDNDCDGKVDEDTAQTVWYLDRDGDGWGVSEGTALARCEPIPGRAANLGDCDDKKNSVHPGVLELCNGIDDDCDGKIDEGADFQCAMDKAIGICKLGACAVLSCYPGRGDCNLDPTDGCECVVPIVAFDTGCATEGGDAYCNDGDYCNGKERCVNDGCYYGTPVNCAASSTVLQGSFFIQNSLDIATLAGIEIISGDLIISGSGLLNLLGLESLKVVGGNLIIIDNQSLIALVGSGLSNLLVVGGGLLIENNKSLTTIRLPSLVTAGIISIRNNSALVTLDGFDQLASITGPLVIGNNQKLAQLTGFATLDNIGELAMFDNALTQLRFPKLRQIRGLVNFMNWDTEAYDDKVVTIDLPELTGIGGSLYIQYMQKITTLLLPKLTTIRGDFSLYNNPLINDPDLRALSTFGPATLSHVEESYSLDVSSNPALKTVSRLGAASINCPAGACGGYVTNNQMLPACNAHAAILRMTNFSQRIWGDNLDSSDLVCNGGSDSGD